MIIKYISIIVMFMIFVIIGTILLKIGFEC
jgi:hypothetical protein